MKQHQKSKCYGVLDEVAAERLRQHEKWGEQNLPDGTGSPLHVFCDEEGIGSAAGARGALETAFANGMGQYIHILLEEVAEVCEERDPAKLRAELIQVAAVAVQWVEKLDREAMPKCDGQC